MQDYDRIVGTNLEATYALCQLMQPLLAAGAAASGPQSTTAAAAATSEGNALSGSADGTRRTRAAGDACIIFISSVAGGPLAGRSGSLYAISKAGLNQLAASLACEWAKDGIRVNSVAPWVTLTELGKQVRMVVVGLLVLLHLYAVMVKWHHRHGPSSLNVQQWPTSSKCCIASVLFDTQMPCRHKLVAATTVCNMQNLKDPALVDQLLSRTPLGRLAQPEDISGQ